MRRPAEAERDLITDTPKKNPESSMDYAQLHRDLAKAVDRVCPRWMADRADDLVQVALMRVMEVQRKKEGTAELSAFYLKKVAYSALIDEIRRLRRRQEVSLEGTTEEEEAVSFDPAAPDPDPERASAGRQVGRAIRDCLGRMVAPRRHAVTLNLQGHSVPEIGRLLGWTAKKAENLVYRGMSDLRGCLGEKGIRH
jgi:RNA polymerase sigma-70 factor, ECF subfamily